MRDNDGGKREMDIRLTGEMTVSDLVLVLMQIDPDIRAHMQGGVSNDVIDSKFEMHLNECAAKASDLVRNEDVLTVRPRKPTGDT